MKKLYNNKLIKYCTNCGLYGHTYKICYNPISSYGIILFKINLDAIELDDKIKILLVQRKHTYSYMDFIRGKYALNNDQNINKLKLNINHMTIEEVNNILNLDFDILWCQLWNINNVLELNNRFKKEYKISKDKFFKLKQGYLSSYFINYLKNIKKTLYKTPEYGFPKGRRNYKETDLNCAIREFIEETNYTANNINILNTNITFNENYIALNNINYEHKYYIAICNTKDEPYIDIKNINQINEINSIQWCSFSSTLKLIRNYEHWKVDLLKNSFLYLINYIQLYKKNKYKQIL